MRAVLIAALVSSAAFAQSVEDWVHAKVAAQKNALKPTPPTVLGPAGQIWRDRGPGRALPGFVPPTSLAPLVKAVRPGVVSIGTQNAGSTLSLGSGFIINPDGFVVTNNHVIERAQQIRVQIADGRDFEATVVGRDPVTDVALLRLPGAKGLPTVSLGDSDGLDVGDWVVAIGNPWGLQLTVTHGIISARERVLGLGEYDDFIQTNAQVHPGSSGGPLFDMRGDVVGVTTATDGRGLGIGYAVPINFVKDLLPNLLDNGRPERGWLGLSVSDVGEGTARTTMIFDVVSGSPAEKAGLKVGDRVLSLGGKPMAKREQLLRKVALLQPGTTVKLEVSRSGKPLELTATLAQRPTAEARYAMVSTGRVDALGFALRELNAGTLGMEPGLRIEAIKPGGPAEHAGFATGDVVVELNREPVSSLKDVEAALNEAVTGEDVLVKFRRGQTLRYVSVRPLDD